VGRIEGQRGNRRPRAVEEKGGHREDRGRRGPYRGQMAVEVAKDRRGDIGLKRGTDGCGVDRGPSRIGTERRRGDSGLMRTQRVIEKIEACRGNRGP
jgi:hypothetical protein